MEVFTPLDRRTVATDFLVGEETESSTVAFSCIRVEKIINDITTKDCEVKEKKLVT